MSRPFFDETSIPHTIDNTANNPMSNQAQPQQSILTPEVGTFLLSIGYQKMKPVDYLCSGDDGRSLHIRSNERWMHPNGHPFPVLDFDQITEPPTIKSVVRMVADTSYRIGKEAEASRRATYLDELLRKEPLA